MAGNPINAQLIDQMSANDANFLGSVYAQCDKRYIQWVTNLPTTTSMSTVGYVNAADQEQILQLEWAFGMVKKLFEGTLASTDLTSTPMIAMLAQFQKIS